MSRINAGLYSSEDQTWETPPEVFGPLDAIFGFTLDVAAGRKTAKCLRYYTEEINALLQEWLGVCWMNPPYGDMLKLFVKKAAEQARFGTEIIGLIPCRTDTKYFQEYVLKKAGFIIFLQGRIKFLRDGIQEGSAPFPTCLVYWGTNTGERLQQIIDSKILENDLKGVLLCQH